MAFWKRPKDPGFRDDDDRSFAVAIRLEMVAQRLALINKELEKELDKHDIDELEAIQQERGEDE
jgi:hypothetical protein